MNRINQQRHLLGSRLKRSLRERLSRSLTLALFISSLSLGCLEEVTQVKLDAYMGTISPGERLPELAPVTESRLLTFDTRSGLMGVSLADQRLLTLCEASRGELSDDSERMICIPESESVPLKFIERLTGSVIMLLDEWMESDKAKPTLPNEGSVFASLIEVPDELDHIAIFNDFGNEVARMKSTTMHGFVGPDHFIINNPPQVWSFKGDLAETATTVEEAEELGLLNPVGSRNFIRHDYPPYGVTYEEREIVYFMGVEERAAKKVGDGVLVGMGERKVISLTREGTFGSRLNVFELSLEISGSPKHSVVLEDVRYGLQYQAQMVGPSKVLLQVTKTKSCGSDDVEYALKSYVINLSSKTQTTLYDAGEPHHVAIGAEGRYAVLSYLDNCGRNMGSADLFDVREGGKRNLPSALRGKVRGAAVSAKGAHIAIMGDEQVWLLDGSSLDHRVAHAGEPIKGGLRFRK